MSLQRVVFFAVVSVYSLMLLAGIGLLGSIGFNIFNSSKINAFPFAIAVFGFGIVRFVLARWLRKLGGVPLEYRAK